MLGLVSPEHVSHTLFLQQLHDHMKDCPLDTLKPKDPGGGAGNCLDLRLRQQWKRTKELWKQQFKQGSIGIKIYGGKCNI